MTILYIKTHNKTGLKYFGKTTKHDVHKYKGSGKYWKLHIAKHGYDVKTEIVGKFEDLDLLQETALIFSRENDIVNSNDWANLILENGLDGGSNPGRVCSEQTRKKISNTLTGRVQTPDSVIKRSKSNKGKKRSKIHCDNQSLRQTGGVCSEETKKKISESNKGRKLSGETKLKISEGNSEDKNGSASRIIIYNENNVAVYECYGNFSKICRENDLPLLSLRTSYQTGGRKIFQNKMVRLKNKDHFKYKGWKAVKEIK